MPDPDPDPDLGTNTDPSRSSIKPRLPGDPDAETIKARMARVDHAGEYGAARIYRGQLDVLGDNHPEAAVIRHMEAGEQRHLDIFNALLQRRRVRPTVLAPVWHVAGYALGAATALMGPKAAMACTAAVEEAIDEHYASQIAALGDTDPELARIIAECRQDEIAHRDTAIAHGAESAPGYVLMRGVMKTGCRAAIWLSERL